MSEEQALPATAEPAAPAPAAPEPSVAPAPEQPEPTIPKSRFDEVYRLRREAERDREYWRELAMRNQPAPKEPEAPQLPTPEQHGFDDAKYQAALTDYNQKVARQAAIEAYQAERQRDQQQQKVQSFKQREAEFAAKNPAYMDKVYNNAVPISQAMAELIAESEDGPSLALYLAEHLDQAAQIYDLPPIQAARELGRIEARLSQVKEPPKPVLTNTPPPPPEIEAVEPAVEKDPMKMSDSEFAKWRKRQIAQRR